MLLLVGSGFEVLSAFLWAVSLQSLLVLRVNGDWDIDE